MYRHCYSTLEIMLRHGVLHVLLFCIKISSSCPVTAMAFLLKSVEGVLVKCRGDLVQLEKKYLGNVIYSWMLYSLSGKQFFSVYTAQFGVVGTMVDCILVNALIRETTYNAF